MPGGLAAAAAKVAEQQRREAKAARVPRGRRGVVESECPQVPLSAFFQNQLLVLKYVLTISISL